MTMLRGCLSTEGPPCMLGQGRKSSEMKPMSLRPKPSNPKRMNNLLGGLNWSMQHHLKHCHGGGGGNGPRETDRADLTAAQGTVGAVEGRGVFRRYRRALGRVRSG